MGDDTKIVGHGITDFFGGFRQGPVKEFVDRLDKPGKTVIGPVMGDAFVHDAPEPFDRVEMRRIRWHEKRFPGSRAACSGPCEVPCCRQGECAPVASSPSFGTWADLQAAVVLGEGLLRNDRFPAHPVENSAPGILPRRLHMCEIAQPLRRLISIEF